jgi:uncharacterized DUF497 family protein
LITIDDIIWFNRIVDKIAWKHNVLPSEVEEVLSGQCMVFRKERGKVDGEHLSNAPGQTEAGRFLSGFFIKKDGNKALIVAARDMNRSKRKRYAKT